MKVKTILEFDYSHGYFDSGHMPELFTITPLADTQQKLKDYQLGFRVTANGFFVYATLSNENEKAYLIQPPAGSRLSFAVYSNDPYLPNYTDMDVNNPAAVFCDPADSQFKGDRALIANPPLAMMSCALPEKPPTEAQQLSITLTSRSVYWRYQITSTDDVAEFSTDDMTKLSIVADGIEFKQSEVINRTVTFLSVEPQELSQIAMPDIQLKDGEEKLVANLPHPNIQQIYQFKSTDEIQGIETCVDEFYALIAVELKCKQN